MLFNWHTLLGLRAVSRHAATGMTRASLTPSIRIAAAADDRPVVRWHVNPQTGRLECRLAGREAGAANPDTELHGAAALLSVYRNGRALR